MFFRPKNKNIAFWKNDGNIKSVYWITVLSDPEPCNNSITFMGINNNEVLVMSDFYGLATVSRIGKSHMKTGVFQLWFLKKKIWSKYTLGIVVSWYNLRNCNIWLFIWHLSPQSGPFHQFWSFLLILFSKTTQKKSKHYSGRAFLEVFGKCVGLGLSSSIQRPQKC